MAIILGSSGLPEQQPNPWVAPATANGIKNPFANRADITEKGKVLFNSLCVPCHGSLGKGDGVAAVAINPRPKNLISDPVQDQTDGVLFWKITTGNPPMASYKTTLTDLQRWQLVNYIRQLKLLNKK